MVLKYAKEWQKGKISEHESLNLSKKIGPRKWHSTSMCTTNLFVKLTLSRKSLFLNLIRKVVSKDLKNTYCIEKKRQWEATRFHEFRCWFQTEQQHPSSSFLPFHDFLSRSSPKVLSLTCTSSPTVGDSNSSILFVCSSFRCSRSPLSSLVHWKRRRREKVLSTHKSNRRPTRRVGKEETRHTHNWLYQRTNHILLYPSWTNCKLQRRKSEGARSEMKGKVT